METVDATTRAAVSSALSDATGSLYGASLPLHAVSLVRSSPVSVQRLPTLFSASAGPALLAPLRLSDESSAAGARQRQLRQTGSAGVLKFKSDEAGSLNSAAGPVERRVLAGRRAASAKVCAQRLREPAVFACECFRGRDRVCVCA